MKKILSYKLFESADYKYSDRDKTNKDSYINIEKHFDITWDHLGWILEDFVKEFNLTYNCSLAYSPVALSRLLPGINNNITIQFTPVNNLTKRLLIKNGLMFFLSNIEDKLEENFPYLTIVNNKDFSSPFGIYNIFTSITYCNSSECTIIILKIKRK